MSRTWTIPARIFVSPSGVRGCSSMVEPLPSKQITRVRFPSSAPTPRKPRATRPGAFFCSYPRMPCQKYAETNSHHRRYRATPAPRAKGYQRRIDNTTNPTITPNSAVQTGHNRFCFRRTLSEDARVISKVKPPTIHITELRAPLGAFSARTTVEKPV